MLEELKRLALAALEAEPTLKREIVQLVGAIEACEGVPRTFPPRQQRRAERYEAAPCERLTHRVE